MSLEYFTKITTDALATAGVAYVGKFSFDLVSSVVSGRQYTAAANLNQVALIGGAFYLAKLVSDAAFDHFIGKPDRTDHQIGKTFIAAKVTSVALLPLNIVAGFETALYAYSASLIGTHIAEKVRNLISSKGAPAAAATN